MTHQFEPLLRKAIAGLDRPDEAAREGVYERVRQALVRQLETSGRGEAEIDQELESFLGAVVRVEKEAAGQADYAAPPGPRAAPGDPPDAAPMSPPQPHKSFPVATVTIVGIMAAVLVAALIAYVVTSRRAAPVAQKARTEAAAKVAAAPAPAAPVVAAAPAAPKDAPAARNAKAVSEDTASYWLRRQRVFYRTTHPPGTIVVSLNQRFLYLVQPNQVAIRYAIGVGPACNNASGLFRITEKVARATPAGPQVTKDTWFDPPALYFDKGRAVHEATEPGRIGHSVSVGCFQAWDQDIADLFERIAVNERLVVAN